MKRQLYISFAVLIFLSCGKTETTAISSITSDWDSHRDRNIEIEGEHVARNSGQLISTTGVLDYITIEDQSGRMDVWFNTAKRRCPPRLGSRVIVEGKVAELVLLDTELGDTVTRQTFVAGSFSIEEEPALASGEIRLCQLSLQDQQMIAMEGVEALQQHWLATGKSARTVIFE